MVEIDWIREWYEPPSIVVGEHSTDDVFVVVDTSLVTVLNGRCVTANSLRVTISTVVKDLKKLLGESRGMELSCSSLAGGRG